MKRLILIVLVMLAGLTQIALSQVRGIPPSVTSLAPGRQFLPGPSVTSLGPKGFSHAPILLGNRHVFRQGRFFGGRGLRSGIGTGGFGAVYVPYAVPVYPMTYEPEVAVTDQDVNDPSGMYVPDSNYAGMYGVSPPSQLRYVPTPETRPAPVVAEPNSSVETQTATRAVKPQPATVLIFKDGHKFEVTNYVIQGATLFNLGDGPRKIAVADLDVPATVRENDNRGVEFKLP